MRNEQPITTDGTVKVTRATTVGSLGGSAGREVKGEEHRALQRNSPVFLQ
jgi:hypothetical protein